MSRTERLIYEKLCLSCADKLRAAKFAVEEQDSGGDGYGICRLCQSRGVFSTYKVYKLRSEREDGG